MDIIYKYLVKKILISSGIILFAITLLLFLLQSLKFLDWITNRGFSILTVLYVSSLTFGGIWLEVIPFAIIIAVIFTWNTIINNQELTIIQASGITPIKTYSSIITVGLIFSVITCYLAFALIPNSYYKYQEFRNNLTNNYNMKIFEPEKFVKVNAYTHFYIKKITGNKLISIFIYSYNYKTNKENFIYAEEGYVDFNSNKITMLLDSVSIQELTSEGAVKFLELDKYIFDIDTAKNYVEYIKNGAREFNTRDLLDIDKIPYVFQLKNNNTQEYNKMIVTIKKEIIKKVNVIFFPLFLSIVASYFFSIRQFKRLGNVKPILQTIVAGASFKILGIISLSFDAYIILFLPLILYIIIGVLMILRIIYPPNLKQISKYKFFA